MAHENLNPPTTPPDVPAAPANGGGQPVLDATCKPVVLDEPITGLKVAALIPTVNGPCMGLQRWLYGPHGQSTQRHMGVLATTVTHRNPGYVEDIRQYLVERFLFYTDAPWLLMVDDDTIPVLSALQLVRGAEEASVLMVASPVPFHPMILDEDSPRGVHVNFFQPALGGAPIRWHDLPWPAKGGPRFHPIESAGFGCTLLHRTVLTTLVDHARKGKLEWPMRAQWRNGRLLRSEDIAFWRRAQKCGFRLYADLANPCSHDKRMVLTPQMAVDDVSFWTPGVHPHPNAPRFLPDPAAPHAPNPLAVTTIPAHEVADGP